MRRAFINRFFPPSLFNHLLLEIKNFSQNVCESLTDAWLRLKSMLGKCHVHDLTKGAIIHIFYHGLDEPTQSILDVTAEGIFLYKSPNQAFQFLDDKVLFKLDWSTKSKNEQHHKSVAFADGSNNDNSRLMGKLEALTIKIDSQFQSLKEEMHEKPNYIQSEDYQNRNSYDSFSHQSLHDPNDSEKSLTELNNDVRNNLKDFKRRICSMRNVHWKLYDNDDRKTTGVLPKKKSKTVNQEP
ncbi:reverse transcriptase domain-containing protein [Tanacetum coccineum]